MSNNNKSYKLSNNAINYNLIYDDCVENLKQLGYYDSQLSSDSEFRHYVTSRAESIAELTKSCYWGRVSANEMLDCCNFIVKQIPGDNTQETDICFDVVKKVIVANRRKSIEDMRMAYRRRFRQLPCGKGGGDLRGKGRGRNDGVFFA